jgi:hypothetical protein
MITARQGHRATLLTDGKVLIEGGYSNGSNDSAPGPELCDPVTGAFRLTGGSSYPSMFPATVSLLTSGKVLATLEYSCDGAEFAELYAPRRKHSPRLGT